MGPLGALPVLYRLHKYKKRYSLERTVSEKTKKWHCATSYSPKFSLAVVLVLIFFGGFYKAGEERMSKSWI